MRWLLGLTVAALLLIAALTAVQARSQARLERLRAERAEFSRTFEADISDISGRDICSGEGGAFERTYVLIEKQ
jgi:hypothetical protein